MILLKRIGNHPTYFMIAVLYLGVSGCLTDNKDEPDWPHTHLSEIEGCWRQIEDSKACDKRCFSVDSQYYDIIYFMRSWEKTNEFSREAFGRLRFSDNGTFAFAESYMKHYTGRTDFDTIGVQHGALSVRKDTLFNRSLVGGRGVHPIGIRLTPENNCGESWIHFQKPDNWDYYSG